MPAVPWVRPSQGSVTAPAKGIACSLRSSRAASPTSSPTSQWPVCSPRAMGVPSAARRPPWVDRMRNSGSSSRFGSQPMPAFCVSPNRFPEGSVRSISGVIGKLPSGPRAWVVVAPYRSAENPGSRLDMFQLRCRHRHLRQEHGQQRRKHQGAGHQKIPGPVTAGDRMQQTDYVAACKPAQRT